MINFTSLSKRLPNSVNKSATMKKKSGLKMLVYLHRISGQSYLFWNFGKTMSLTFKLLLLTLNSLLFIGSLFFSYLNVEDARKMSKKLLLSSHTSIMSFIMQIVVYICWAVMILYVFSLTLIRGKSIFMFLYDMDIVIDENVEKRIGIKTIVMHITLTLLISQAFFFTEILFAGFEIDSFNIFMYRVMMIFITSSFFSLLSPMAYFCYVIEQKLADIVRGFTSLAQLSAIFKQIILVQSLVKKFNGFYNKYLCLMIMIFSFECVSSLTMLYFDRFSTTYNPIAAIFESLLQIFLFCHFSEKIDKSYARIINKFEQLQLEMGEINLARLDHSLVSRLYSLRQDMCFTASDLYPINTKVYFSITSLIVTFTVILIQTRD